MFIILLVFKYLKKLIIIATVIDHVHPYCVDATIKWISHWLTSSLEFFWFSCYKAFIFIFHSFPPSLLNTWLRKKKDAYGDESNLPSFDSAILIFFLFPISLHHLTA